MKYARFAEAISEARAAKDKAARHAPVVAFLQDGEAVAEMGIAAVDDPASVEALLLDLSGLPGMAGIAARVRALFKEGAERERERRRVGLRLAEEDDERPPIRLADHLPELDVPERYVIDDGGISERRESIEGIELVRICRRPIVPSLVLSDIDTGLRSVRLDWRERRRWGSRVVPASSVQDPRSFVRLRDYGAPVAAHNARQIARFLDEIEEHNADALPRAWSTRRMGWMRGGELGFALGHDVIGSDKVIVQIDPDGSEAQIADALRPSGSLDAWLSAVERVSMFPSVMLAIYASICAPLLQAIPSAPNPIIGWCGETSMGKTTVLRLAASVWGDPDERGVGLISKWNQTPVYLERFAAFCGGLPVCLDDTNDVPMSRRDVISGMLYHFAGGKGRGRGRPDGTRRTESWRSALLSTGEAALTSYSQDAGARARTLVLMGAPFGDGHQEDVVADLTMTCLEHHGHFGQRIIRELLDGRDQWPDIASRYEERCVDYADVSTRAATKRLAKIVVLLEEAKALAEQCGLPVPACDPIAYAWTAAQHCGADTDRPLAALRAVHGWAVAHSAEFWGRHSQDRDGVPRQPARGWAGKWDHGPMWDRIAFVPDCLDRVLAYHGFDPAAVLPLWYERGWLITSEGRRTCRVRIDGNQVRCVALDGRAVRQFAEG